jgi:hypothetical protein
VGFFFDGLSCAEYNAVAVTEDDLSPLTRDSLQLAKHIDSIRDKPLKLQVVRLVKSLSDSRLMNGAER